MPYQVILEENAKQDIRKAVRWIAANAENDPFVKSAAWFAALQDALDSLSELPFVVPMHLKTDSCWKKFGNCSFRSIASFTLLAATPFMCFIFAIKGNGP